MQDFDGSPLDADSLAVVSNREPYSHGYGPDGIEVSRPKGGLVTALDGVLREAGGTWIAWGSGDADFGPEIADDGVVPMPPETGEYTLRRVPLKRQQVEDYYYGYSNQVLWPVCHLSTEHIRVEPGFWNAYEAVNRQFAEEIIASGHETVWFQDYHLARAPRHVRTERPEASLAQFWHIPWPHPDAFAVTPHTEDLLDGLLANDAVGFHTEQYRRNFLRCVDALLDPEAVDFEAGTVGYRDRATETFVAPIGVDPESIAAKARADDASGFWNALRKRHDFDEETTVALGVDRLDYTKGILERLDALAHLWERRPDLRERLVYVQKATESRTHIDSYRWYRREVIDRIDEINSRFATDDWTPIVYLDESVARDALLGLYRNADVCLVTSKRDGMNLVAKEFVAASRGADGVLVCSEFAGAAESLCPAAIPVNPVDIPALADAIERATDMDADERADRLGRLQRAVVDEDIESWFVTNLTHL
ncbi:trehalose-6-phosphate synthase [Natronomonas halophila]|uniref:alpha,alpha-trehalose-phosphate synthase (UDP-forming) n=1 Tax=Natronomonas halophila TaxID=2747817 RepID=UPI0015B6BF33|nr:trehalose-6-phosphate synthase [Natronomonas halophila]QLD84551.1 trehalose-6-phosphate synthase [Natronomonas halophila]